MKNNMKKIFAAFVLTICLASCVSPHRVIGDEYVVTSVRKMSFKTYGTNYYVIAKPLNNKGADAFTFNGNVMKYYTNTFYSVGDIIKVSNKNETIREREVY